MGELRSPGLDGAWGLLFNTDSLADHTLPTMEELVAQSSSLFGPNVEVNTPAIPLEAQSSMVPADVAASEGLNQSKLHEKEEKLLLEALEEAALHFSKYDANDGTAYPQPSKQNRKKKSSVKINQPLMDRKLKLRWKVFGATRLHKCNLCPSEFTKRLELLIHKMERHQKPKLSHPKQNKPSGGKKTRAGFNQSNDDLKELRTPRSTLAVPSDHSEHGQSKNLNGSSISQEWLCCHHCDYKSHRYDFFNIHMERAHYEEEDKPTREKKRRLDSESTNARKGGVSSMGTKSNIGSVPKSKSDYLAVLFECETCHKQFNSRTSCNIHAMRHDSSKWKKCPYCDYCAITNHSMKLHIGNMHPDKTVQPNPQGRKNKEASKKQSQNAAREGYLKCNVCQKELMENKLKRHMLLHDPTELIACSFCPYTAYTEYNVKLHMSKIHPDKFFPKASKSNNRFASSRLSLGRSKPTTPLVSKVTGSVEMKKKSKESEKTAQCTVCRKYVLESLMSMHLRSHDKGKWLRCKQCDYVSHRQDYMKHHVDTIHSPVSGRISTGSKPIKDGCKECPICLTVVVAKNLRIHLFAHDPSKWKRCDHCEYTSADPFMLKRHLASHARRKEKTNLPSELNECPYCEYSTRLMSKINSHIKSEHPELNIPESVQQRESFEESDDDDYGPYYELSPKSIDTQSDEKSLDFSAIGKILSAVIPSSRGRAVKS